MLTRRTVIQAIKETTYGTDPAMTAANALLVWDVDFDAKGEILRREILRDSISQMSHVIGMKECSLNFKAEIKGGGVIPSYPELGTLLLGCGFNTGVVTTTTMVFSLVSAETAMNSLSFIVNIDGNAHKILGARGTVKFNLEAGKYGIAEFAFQGMYDTVSATALPDISGVAANNPPIVYNSSFQIGGFSPVCSKAEIDLANEVVRRDSLNAPYGVAGFRITNRKPNMGFDPDAVVESSNPFWGDWAGNIVDTFGVQIGSVPGNIVKITGIYEYDTLKYGDQDGIRKFDCKAALVSSNVNTQNDELAVTFI
jgi:hypothetical protein